MGTQKPSPMGLVEDKLGVRCERERRMGTREAWVCTTGGWHGDRREGEKAQNPSYGVCTVHFSYRVEGGMAWVGVPMV